MKVKDTTSTPPPPPPPPLSTGRQLIDAKAVAAKLACDFRTVLRLADAGRMPWGIKLGGLRRWDLREVDEWIVNGCEPVRTIRERGEQ